MSVTRVRREAARAALARSTRYDPQSMQVTAKGFVTAHEAPDKVRSRHYGARYLVAHLDEMVSQDGQILEGW